MTTVSEATYTPALASALTALRLNQHFPSAERLVALLTFLGNRGKVRIDDESGLPLGGEWARLWAEHAEAAQLLAAWTGAGSGGDAHRRRLAELSAIPGPPVREVDIALRYRDGPNVSLLVRIDRIDLTSGSIARYTLIVSDALAGDERQVLEAAHKRLDPRLDVLAAQDAGVAFALLREGQGLHVEEIVRGVIGPMLVPGVAGPAELRSVPVVAPLLSACLERASIDLRDAKVDDPLAHSVVLAAPTERFGVSRQRKWAASRADLTAVKQWLAARGSRNLVYGW